MQKYDMSQSYRLLMKETKNALRIAGEMTEAGEPTRLEAYNVSKIPWIAKGKWTFESREQKRIALHEAYAAQQKGLFVILWHKETEDIYPVEIEKHQVTTWLYTLSMTVVGTAEEIYNIHVQDPACTK